MTGPGYTVTNLAAQGAVSSSGDDPNWPAANLAGGNMAVPHKWSGLGGWVEYFFSVPVAPLEIFLFNHDYDPSAAISLAGGPTTNPSAEVFPVAWASPDIWATIAPGSAYSYWRLTVTDFGGPDKSQTQTGSLWLCILTELTARFLIDWSGDREFRQSVLRTGGGVPWKQKRWRQRVFSHRFEDLDDTMFSEVETMVEDFSFGTPGIWVADGGSKVFAEGESEVEVHERRWQNWRSRATSFAFREHSRGKEILR